LGDAAGVAAAICVNEQLSDVFLSENEIQQKLQVKLKAMVPSAKLSKDPRQLDEYLRTYYAG